MSKKNYLFQKLEKIILMKLNNTLIKTFLLAKYKIYFVCSFIIVTYLTYENLTLTKRMQVQVYF